MIKRLDRHSAVLVVIDVQEKFIPVIHSADELLQNIDRLIRGTHILGIPAIVTEQYVKGLGSTAEPIRKALEETDAATPIEKMCFSSFGATPFAETLGSAGRRQVLVCGIETHVCVWQTVADLLSAAYDVTVIADAVSSRSPRNKEIALHRMETEGARLSSTEMALFELTVAAGTNEFRAISKLVK